ncbi:hypothetical protein [Caryophanon latum]|uniref:DUF3800 domain-containing protein n=1 Tax=Caryophanon latum TaxID=33977 RepID=A0A1C0YUW8_9BACL|nr:hypothetical protein [Caryophanon latum]OCS90960.1 hypothetical protein A6K76_10325 [Caryophanon latum]
MTQSSNLLICFDESGKNSRDPIQLMGALSVPYNIYQHPNYQAFHDLNKEYSYHWKNYGGDSKSRNGIIKLFELATGLVDYMNFNLLILIFPF